MRVALLGYGKMGRAIDQIAADHNAQVCARLGPDWKEKDLEGADVCIEFTTPDAAPKNIERVLKLGIPLVVGTTAWELPNLDERVTDSGTSFLHAPNFALGLFLFSQLAKRAGQLLGDYDRAGIELHHNQKKDRPSGTALALSKLVPDLKFESVRCGSEPGTHTILFDGPADTITLTYSARGRTPYATGALAAAHFIQNKQGLFTLEDLCSL